MNYGNFDEGKNGMLATTPITVTMDADEAIAVLNILGQASHAQMAMFKMLDVGEVPIATIAHFRNSLVAMDKIGRAMAAASKSAEVQEVWAKRRADNERALAMTDDIINKLAAVRNAETSVASKIN